MRWGFLHAQYMTLYSRGCSKPRPCVMTKRNPCAGCQTCMGWHWKGAYQVLTRAQYTALSSRICGKPWHCRMSSRLGCRLPTNVHFLLTGSAAETCLVYSTELKEWQRSWPNLLPFCEQWGSAFRIVWFTHSSVKDRFASDVVYVHRLMYT